MCVNTTIQAKTLRLAHNYTYMLIHTHKPHISMYDPHTYI